MSIWVQNEKAFSKAKNLRKARAFSPAFFDAMPRGTWYGGMRAAVAAQIKRILRFASRSSSPLSHTSIPLRQ